MQRKGCKMKELPKLKQEGECYMCSSKRECYVITI